MLLQKNNKTNCRDTYKVNYFINLIKIKEYVYFEYILTVINCQIKIIKYTKITYSKYSYYQVVNKSKEKRSQIPFGFHTMKGDLI